MAVFLNNLAGFQIQNSTYIDLSNHVKSLTINRTFDELEVTAMGDTGHKFVAGLEASTIAIDFFNDTATASGLQTLNALVGTSAAFKAIQTTTAAVSTTNPLYSGLVLVNKLTPVNGTVADISMQSLTFTVNGAVTVATSGTW